MGCFPIPCIKSLVFKDLGCSGGDARLIGTLQQHGDTMALFSRCLTICGQHAALVLFLNITKVH